MITRRTYLKGGLFAAAGAFLSRAVSAQSPHEGHEMPAPPTPATRLLRTGSVGYTPVVTPNGATLPWVMKNGVKEFHLTAEPVKREFAPGMVVNCWGYNGQTPGPTIEAVEGDRVRILVTNGLKEHTTIHWHGIFLPNGMDGVGGLTQPQIKPGETYAYEFTLRQHGTHLYHPHADETVQMALGMMGFFIIHPRKPSRRIDRDFCIFPHMWFVEPGSMTPNPSVMLDFNIFTFNSRAFPGTDSLVVKRGDRVRLRLANISMTDHPIHIHGHRFWVVETDGGQIPESAWWPETTLNIMPGTTRAVEFVADLPGDWPLHCHKSHHAMNAMSHNLPNVIGVDQREVGKKIAEVVPPGYMTMGTDGMAEHADHVKHHPGLPNTLPMMMGEGPFGNIEMGGMFTVFKVREGISSYEDPGWYKHPPGTVAKRVDAAAPDEPAAAEPRHHGGG
jgi:manganese oxidase